MVIIVFLIAAVVTYLIVKKVTDKKKELPFIPSCKLPTTNWLAKCSLFGKLLGIAFLEKFGNNGYLVKYPRRCPSTWWAPPPSKRVGRVILVRRVRFPSTSAMLGGLDG